MAPEAGPRGREGHREPRLCRGAPCGRKGREARVQGQTVGRAGSWAVCEGTRCGLGASELILSKRGNPQGAFPAKIKKLDLIFKGSPWRLVGGGCPESMPNMPSPAPPFQPPQSGPLAFPDVHPASSN